jgi:peroxiredoxin
MIDMKLELDKIRGLRDQFVPATQTVVMDRAIDDLVASGIRQSSLKVGDRIPAFSLPNTRGEQVDVQALLQSGPIVLSFYRGSWCPYCNIELRALQQVLPEIENLGASIVAISPELPDRQIVTEKELALKFPVLTDMGNDVARRFGIVYEMPEDLLDVYRERGHELDTVNGPSGANTLALPATFVVDRSGTIRMAYIDEDYARRLSVDKVLVALSELYLA